jgi:hypothetical protein
MYKQFRILLKAELNNFYSRHVIRMRGYLGLDIVRLEEIKMRTENLQSNIWEEGHLDMEM